MRAFAAAAFLLFPRFCEAAGDEAKLLELVMASPTTAFTGKKLVTTWYGRKSRAAEIRVYFKPPGRWRHEVLDASGKVVRTTIQRGGKEWILRAGRGTAIERDIKGLRKGELGRDDLRRLLSANYELRALGDKKVMDLPAAGISMRPKAKAGSGRLIWLDKKTGIVLHRRHSNHRGKVVRESRLVQLAVGADVPDDLFDIHHGGKREILKEPARERIPGKAELVNAGFPAALWRNSLPFGFELDSARVIPVTGEKILHLRYSDGLDVLSLFSSPYEIDASAVSRTSSEEVEDDIESYSWAGGVLGWAHAGRHFLLVGDFSLKNLKEIRTLTGAGN